MNETNKTDVLRTTVDRLGFLRAGMTEIRKRMKNLEKTLIDSGEKVVRGHTFRANIHEFDLTTTDYKSICYKLNASEHILKTYSKTNKITSVNIRAYKNKG